jgi:type IV pilus assembly protein PilB
MKFISHGGSNTKEKTGMVDDPLGKILVERQFLDIGECRELLSTAILEDCFLEEILIRENRFSRRKLLTIIENEYFYPAADLEEPFYDPDLLSVIPRTLAVRLPAYPVRIDDKIITVAFFYPDDKSREAISAIASRRVSPLVALRHDLRDTINRSYDRLEREFSALEPQVDNKMNQNKPDHREPAGNFSTILLSLSQADKQSMITLLDKIIDRAVTLGVTDIHVEPKKKGLDLRFRIDGVLFNAAKLPGDLSSPLVSRIKILSGMDIAERRLPQDGRHTLKRGEKFLDLRVSSVPSQFGEKIVIRILNKTAELLKLDDLEIPPAVREGYQEAVKSPQGLYLVTGPTGSGKTTTLYATLQAIDRESINVMTLEDPIEYSLPGITQVQIHEDIGLTFATGLRHFLRQDPDVILIGEIRDAETVAIACRAAMTGHKVFSTLHTNDAAQVIPRLVEMGAPSYLVAATLRGILAQRLVRVLCRDCKEAYAPNYSERTILGNSKVEKLYRSRGCRKCSGTGYKGRLAIFEYLSITENILKLIYDRTSSFAIRHAARQNGMITLTEFAKQAVLNGKTSVAEIQRAVFSDEGREQLCHHCGQVVSLDFAVCPFCQITLKEKCSGCGHPLDPTWEACPNCGTEIESELRKTYCPHCQAPLTGNRESCPFCGGGL